MTLGLEIDRYIGGEAYILEHKIKQGRILGQHKHAHDHLSYLASGTVEVTIGDEVKDYTGPCCIFVPKNTMHMVAALTDAVWLCVWSADYLDGDAS